MNKILTILTGLMFLCQTAFSADIIAKRVAVDDAGGYFTTDNVESALQQLGASSSVEVQDQAYSSVNFNGDTTHAVSQDDLYDLFHIADADDDGLIDKIDTASNGFVKTSGGTGAISIDTASYQTLDATLTALAAYSTNGIVTQTASDTFTGRTLTGDTENVISNGNGVSGNPTFSIGSTITRDAEWDSEAEVQTAWGAVNILLETEIDASTELLALMDDETGTGSLVFANTPTLVTPVLGVATATSINKLALTAPATSATLTIADGKTLTSSNTLTLAGTDSTTITFQGTDTYVGRTTTDTLTNKTLTSPTINTPLLTLSTTTSTSDARLYWDTTGKNVIAGDGTNSVVVAPKTKILFSMTINAPATTNDSIMRQMPRAVTITKVTMKCTGGTNVVGRLYEVDGDGDQADQVGVETGDWTVTTTETEDVSFNNATLDAGDYLAWDTTSVSGSVTAFNLIVEGYET